MTANTTTISATVWASAFTRYESDYDNGSSRDEVVAQVLAPLIYTTEGLKAVSMPRLGIGWGEYKRRIGSDESKADVKITITALPTKSAKK